ncbi:hypothetical protein VTL71DRAFT_3486 [Oculimacula yallundae]|uniref:Heterokaryon incompatibility domain-containing protein n=1 Tax=Oculimacula yallundae TaxID=86028 RepID=A0ABR4C7A4_9HELO
MDPTQSVSDNVANREADIVDTDTSDANINTPSTSEHSGDEDDDNSSQVSISEATENPRPWHRNDKEIEDLKLPVYNFTDLNLSSQEMRFLILHPHNGKEDSPLHVSFSVENLNECKPYTALINTRGNPFDTALVIIDGAVWSTSPNIWVYLNHVRHETEEQRFWFRDLCINHRVPSEKAAYWNQEWMDTMNSHASNTIDMSSILTSLWDAGHLTPPFSPRPLNDRSFGDLNTKIHCPIPLALAAEYAKGVAGLPDHTYLPLDYVANETRIITISSADNYDDPLVGLMGYNPLHSYVSYTCVSYMWGPSSEPATELLELSGQRVIIRKNLDTFLRTVRTSGSGYMRFWIDAVCIDQQNIEERNRQLPRILEVYEDADIVACWAGSPDETSNLALGLVSDLQPTHFSIGNHFFETGWIGVKDREDFPRRLAALWRFLLRPYFRRIWVAQELAAAKRPYLTCGKEFVVEWKRIDHAAWKLLDILYSDEELVAKIYAVDPGLRSIPLSELSFVRRLFYLRHLRQGKVDEIEENRYSAAGLGNYELWYIIPPTAPGILDLVTLCRDFEATVPQDKVFALLNLATDTAGMEFTMDYTKSLAQTWMQFAIAVAKQNRSLDIICAAEPAVADGLAIPSWCPDWSTKASASSMVRRTYVPITLMRAMHDIGGPIYHAAGTSPNLEPRFSFNGSILECAGIILDTVGLIGPYDHEPSETVLGNQTIWNEWMEMAAGALQSDSDAALPLFEQEFQGRFWGMLAGHAEGGSSSSSPKDLRKYIPGYNDDKENALIKNKGRDQYHVVTRGRVLVITENGFMGLAPSYVQEGAKIALLSCCSSPVLLYESAEGDGTYRFGGSVFVQGLMRGEGLRNFGDMEEEAWDVIEGRGRLKIV